MIAVPDGKKRVQTLRNFFIQHESPLFDSAETFVIQSEKMRIPLWILVGIANAESSLGKRVEPGTHNPFGYKCYDGKPCHAFHNWDEAIISLAWTLRHEHYYEDFRKSGDIQDIAKRYLSGNKQRWMNNVKHYKDEIL